MAFFKDTLWILGEGVICAGLIALVSLHPGVPCCVTPTTTTLPPNDGGGRGLSPESSLSSASAMTRTPNLLPQAQPWGGIVREEYWGYSRVYPQQNYEWVQVP